MLFSRHVDAATGSRASWSAARTPTTWSPRPSSRCSTSCSGGGGPDVAFRAYLLTAVRRLHVDKIRSTQRAHDHRRPRRRTTRACRSPTPPSRDSRAARPPKAFASLPERWQLVLWHLEVENQKPAEIAPLLGMSANSVSALAYRAREGLRQAFLNMHTSDLERRGVPRDPRPARWLRPRRPGPSATPQGRGAPRRLPPMHRDLPRAGRGQLELAAGLLGPALLGAARRRPTWVAPASPRSASRATGRAFSAPRPEQGRRPV